MVCYHFKFFHLDLHHIADGSLLFKKNLITITFYDYCLRDVKLAELNCRFRILLRAFDSIVFNVWASNCRTLDERRRRRQRRQQQLNAQSIFQSLYHTFVSPSVFFFLFRVLILLFFKLYIVGRRPIAAAQPRWCSTVSCQFSHSISCFSSSNTRM